MKREFLVENSKKITKYLQKNSLTCKLYKYKDKDSYLYEFEDYTFILEEYKKFSKLVFIGDTDMVLDEIVNKFKEITDDKRYSKKYLKLFGDPKSSEFDEKKVFKKCDEAGLSRLDLHFRDGMSSSKVFKVILYRLNQIFILEYEKYLKKKLEYDRLKESHEKLLCAIKLSKKVFDKKIVKCIKADFEDLYMLLNHHETFDRYVLNFQIFIEEKSFYEVDNSNEPIYFFDKKDSLLALI